jgi:hypothetical protein
MSIETASSKRHSNSTVLFRSNKHWKVRAVVVTLSHPLIFPRRKNATEGWRSLGWFSYDES